MGTLILFSVICETFFLKTFLAVSSILNSLLVLLTLVTVNVVDFYFYI